MQKVIRRYEQLTCVWILNLGNTMFLYLRYEEIQHLEISTIALSAEVVSFCFMEDMLTVLVSLKMIEIYTLFFQRSIRMQSTQVVHLKSRRDFISFIYTLVVRNDMLCDLAERTCFMLFYLPRSL